MRMGAGVIVASMLLSVFLAQRLCSSGQDAGKSNSDEGKPEGVLVVWRVVAGGQPRVRVAGADGSTQPGGPGMPTISAGSYGQTAGGFGQTAGSVGQTAGSTGQTAGSTGQSAGSVGQSAGSVGQTAGSVGESVSTIADAAARAQGQRGVKVDPEWAKFQADGRDALEGVDITYVDVSAAELSSRLADASENGGYPDVLVGSPLPAVWTRPDARSGRSLGLLTVGNVGLIAQTEVGEGKDTRFVLQSAILRSAPHPWEARVFVDWVLDCAGCGGPARPAVGVEALAREAVGDALTGAELGGMADREMAEYDAGVAQTMALAVNDSGVVNNLKVRFGGSHVQANGRFAVAEVNAEVEGKSVYGVARAIVVMRKDDAGEWRVLQVTPNLRASQQGTAWRLLSPFAEHVKPEEEQHVVGVRQVVPADGDNRNVAPEFWWDNGGGAGLEAIEWQRVLGEKRYTGSNLYLVPDDGGHLRTRVTARFARLGGKYRWRIWALGRGGGLVLSPWRTVNIVSR